MWVLIFNVSTYTLLSRCMRKDVYFYTAAFYFFFRHLSISECPEVIYLALCKSPNTNVFTLKTLHASYPVLSRLLSNSHHTVNNIQEWPFLLLRPPAAILLRNKTDVQDSQQDLNISLKQDVRLVGKTGKNLSSWALSHCFDRYSNLNKNITSHLQFSHLNYWNTSVLGYEKGFISVANQEYRCFVAYFTLALDS